METAFFTLFFTILGIIISGATGALSGAGDILPILIQSFLGFFLALIGV